MRPALLGRIVFGMSAIVAGIVTPMSHDSQIWQRLQPIGLAPATVLAWCVGAALILAGVAIMFSQAARIASMVIGTIYLLDSVGCIADIVAKPADPGSYVEIFELFSVVCGAIAVYTLAHPNSPHALAQGRFARIALGICTLSFAWAQVAFFHYTASLVPAWIPPSQGFWTWLTTAAFALAAIAMLINVQARLAMRLMAVMMALFGILVWVPHIVAQPDQLSNWIEISENYLMTGAAWLVAELAVF